MAPFGAGFAISVQPPPARPAGVRNRAPVSIDTGVSGLSMEYWLSEGAMRRPAALFLPSAGDWRGFAPAPALAPEPGVLT